MYNLDSGKISKRKKDDVGGDYIQLIKESKAGTYFIGTFASGLILYDPKLGVIHHYKHSLNDSASLSYNDVRDDVVEEENGNAWVATWGGGLCYFNNEKQTFTPFRKNESKPHAISSDNFTCLAEGPAGKIWVGTFGGGLNLFDTRSRRFTQIGTANSKVSFGSFNIISLLKDTHCFLWIETWGQGLCRLDTESRKLVRFNKIDGIDEKNITALAEDAAGNIWMSTKNSIFKYDNAAKIFKRYTQLNGEYHIRSVYAGKDYLYFSGAEGVVSFNPERLKEQVKEPDIKLTGFKIFNENAKPGNGQALDKNILYEDHIELKHDQSLITFEFAALIFLLLITNMPLS